MSKQEQYEGRGKKHKTSSEFSVFFFFRAFNKLLIHCLFYSKF
jgi:hypothetical protein